MRVFDDDEYEGTIRSNEEFCMNCGELRYEKSSVPGICVDCMSIDSLSSESNTRLSPVYR